MPAGLPRTAALGLLLAGVLTLTACGGSDSSSDTGTAASTQAATQAAADSGSFCDDFAGVADDITVNLDEGDPTTMGDRFAKAADALKNVQPPAEIADDWNTLITFYEQFGQAFANSDLSDDASIDKVGEALQKLESNAKDLAAATTNVAQYASQNC